MRLHVAPVYLARDCCFYKCAACVGAVWRGFAGIVEDGSGTGEEGDGGGPAGTGGGRGGTTGGKGAARIARRTLSLHYQL